VELCVAISQRKTPYGRKRTGLCSGYIANLVEGDVVRMCIRKGVLHGSPFMRPELQLSSSSDATTTASGESSESGPVANSPPLILIGPGTGVAPMRALIQHEIATMHLKRQQLQQSQDEEEKQQMHEAIDNFAVRSSSSPSSSAMAMDTAATGEEHKAEAEVETAASPSVVLYFGCRKRERDFLFRDEFDAINGSVNPFRQSLLDGNYLGECLIPLGSIVVDTAFSQDQLVKDYVTHHIKRNGKAVCELLLDQVWGLKVDAIV
jgi:sulfite reductase alpha subunit-like flavoprotein